MSLKIISPLIINDSNLLDSNMIEDEAPIWDDSTTYNTDDEVIRLHVVYTSLVDGNVNIRPEDDDGTNWLPGLATNRYKAFDSYLQDQSTEDDQVYWEIGWDGKATTLSVALLNVIGNEVVITFTRDSDGAVTFNQTYNMLTENNILDYDDFFFEPAIQIEDLAVSEIPSAVGVVRIEVNKPGAEAAVGQLAVGDEIEIGKVVDGLDQDLELFSDKTADTFGRVFAIKRASSDIFQPLVKIQTSRLNFLRRELKKREAVPTVYVMNGPTQTNEYVAYGDFERLQTVSRWGEYSDMRITIREYV